MATKDIIVTKELLELFNEDDLSINAKTFRTLEHLFKQFSSIAPGAVLGATTDVVPVAPTDVVPVAPTDVVPVATTDVVVPGAVTGDDKDVLLIKTIGKLITAIITIKGKEEYDDLKGNVENKIINLFEKKIDCDSHINQIFDECFKKQFAVLGERNKGEENLEGGPSENNLHGLLRSLYEKVKIICSNIGSYDAIFDTLMANRNIEVRAGKGKQNILNEIKTLTQKGKNLKGFKYKITRILAKQIIKQIQQIIAELQRIIDFNKNKGKGIDAKTLKQFEDSFPKNCKSIKLLYEKFEKILKDLPAISRNDWKILKRFDEMNPKEEGENTVEEGENTVEEVKDEIDIIKDKQKKFKNNIEKLCYIGSAKVDQNDGVYDALKNLERMFFEEEQKLRKLELNDIMILLKGKDRDNKKLLLDNQILTQISADIENLNRQLINENNVLSKKISVLIDNISKLKNHNILLAEFNKELKLLLIKQQKEIKNKEDELEEKTKEISKLESMIESQDKQFNDDLKEDNINTAQEIEKLKKEKKKLDEIHKKKEDLLREGYEIKRLKLLLADDMIKKLQKQMADMKKTQKQKNILNNEHNENLLNIYRERKKDWQTKINDQQSEMEEQNKQINDQRSEMEEQNKKINDQESKMEKQEIQNKAKQDKIDEQKKQLKEQLEKIDNLKKIIEKKKEEQQESLTRQNTFRKNILDLENEIVNFEQKLNNASSNNDEQNNDFENSAVEVVEGEVKYVEEIEKLKTKLNKEKDKYIEREEALVEQINVVKDINKELIQFIEEIQHNANKEISILTNELMEERDNKNKTTTTMMENRNNIIGKEELNAYQYLIFRFRRHCQHPCFTEVFKSANADDIFEDGGVVVIHPTTTFGQVLKDDIGKIVMVKFKWDNSNDNANEANFERLSSVIYEIFKNKDNLNDIQIQSRKERTFIMYAIIEEIFEILAKTPKTCNNKLSNQTQYLVKNKIKRLHSNYEKSKDMKKQKK